ncbi:restriction endonuclease subunit S [Candidatus Binatus sp.]|uniref:restriction endonuclease subunit S n=1 Tax=Candidatus Binatus sp. TaxID=2811406 RepID=UPI003BAEA9DB
MKTPAVQVGELALNNSGAFKIGPFGSSLKKTELVESGIPVAGIENVLPNKFVKGFRRFITPRKFDQLSDYEILPDDVLVTTMGTIGRAASAPPDIGRVIFDSHLFRMRVNTSRVFPPYLCYAINSDLVASQLVRMARGAIMEGLNTTILRECSIPLPDMSEQRRIAGQLEKADRLCRTRRYAVELTDTFLPAAFLELFGDPQTNSKGWDMSTIEDVVVFSQYGTSQKSNSDKQGYPVLGMVNITTKGSLDLSTLAYVNLPKDEFQGLALQRGDIIFNRTNSAELVGKTACWNVDMSAVLASYLVRLRLKPEVLPEFFSALLNTGYFKNLFRDRCKKAVGQSNISPTLLKEFPAYIPPLSLQQKFATLVEQVERLRAVQREELRQAEHLFASLLDRSFGATGAHQ